MQKEAVVFWKFRKTSITIPIELHEKIARSCEPIDQVPSEVISLRSSRKRPLDKKDQEATYRHFFAHGV